MLGDVTEAQADKACRTLKRAIDAAENSNQAGENFVVAAAAGEDLLTALRRLAGNAGALRAFEHEIRAVTGHTNWQCLMDAVADADAAIAKATGSAA